MSADQHFSEVVAEKLQHYVYRLIDPRNGNTFYVGRGSGDRVFAHAAGERIELEPGESDPKLSVIRKIRNAGLAVQHVIHRHGLSKKEAQEVEAALIQAYQGLTNLQSGYAPERGVMHANEIIQLYEAPEAVLFHSVLLVNVNQSAEDLDPLDAARYAWPVDKRRAEKCEYVLSVRKGLIVGAFVAERWLKATPENFPSFEPVTGRKFGFLGHEAPHNIKQMYCQKRLPEQYRKRHSIGWGQSSVLYSKNS